MKNSTFFALLLLGIIASSFSDAKEEGERSHSRSGSTQVHHGNAQAHSRSNRRTQLRLMEEEELLKGERLLHVKPRPQLHANSTGLEGLKKDRKSATLTKAGAKKGLVFKKLGKTSLLLASGSPSKRDFASKKRQRGGQAKKYDPKKHSWKKQAHKDKAKKRQEHAKERKRAGDSLRELIKGGGHKAHKRQVRARLNGKSSH